MDIVKIGSHKVASGKDTNEVLIELDTINDFTMQHLYFYINKKVDHNNIRATVTINGGFVASDSILSMNFYKTQYLDKDAYQDNSGNPAYTPNAPLFVSFTSTGNEKSGVPIYGRHVTNLTVKLFAAADFVDLLIDVYAVGFYSPKSIPAGFSSHYNLETGLNKINSDSISYTKDYDLAGKNMLGIGYINTSSKTLPDLELQSDGMSNFSIPYNHKSYEYPAPTKLIPGPVLTVEEKAADDYMTKSLNTVTYPNDIGSSKDFSKGQSLPFFTNEFNGMIGNNNVVLYVSQTWGFLTAFAPLKSSRFIMKFSGDNFEVMPFYTKFHRWS